MPPRSSSSATAAAEPLVRKALLVETLGASFVQGQQCLGGPRRDTALFKEQQLGRLSAARSLLASASRGVRPSLLTSPASAAAFALGAATALAASALPATGAAYKAKGLVSRALEGAASDSYNESLSALHRARTRAAAAEGGGGGGGKSENKGDNANEEQHFRAVLRELRDSRRAPDYSGGFADSSASSFSSWEGEEGGGGEEASAKASFGENVDAAVFAAEAAIRAAAGLVFRAGEKL